MLRGVRLKCIEFLFSYYREAPSVKSNTSLCCRCARFARNLCCCTCSHVWLEPLKEWKKRELNVWVDGEEEEKEASKISSHLCEEISSRFWHLSVILAKNLENSFFFYFIFLLFFSTSLAKKIFSDVVKSVCVLKIENEERQREKQERKLCFTFSPISLRSYMSVYYTSSLSLSRRPHEKL